MQDAKNITFYPSESAPHISGRAVEILALTAQGLKSPQIANIMCRSVPTIRFHQVEARKFYHARCLTEAVAKAIALGDIQFRIGPATEKTPAQHAFAAFSFIALVLFTAAIDTPFVTDHDVDIRKTSQTLRVKTRIGRHGLFVINEEIIG